MIDIYKLVAPWLAARDALKPGDPWLHLNTTIQYPGFDVQVTFEANRDKELWQLWSLDAIGYRAKGETLADATANLLEDIQGDVKTLAGLLGAKTLPVTEVVDLASEHQAMDKAAVEYLTNPDNFPVKEERPWFRLSEMADIKGCTVDQVVNMAAVGILESSTLDAAMKVREPLGDSAPGLEGAFISPVTENAP